MLSPFIAWPEAIAEFVELRLSPERQRVHPPEKPCKLDQAALGAAVLVQEYPIKRLAGAKILQNDQSGLAVAAVQAWCDRVGAGDIAKELEPGPVVEQPPSRCK